MKKRLISLFVALTMLLCLIPAAFAATFNAGTYTASANGMNGAVTVEVTFSDSAITDVKVTEQAETPAIASGALEQIPADIVAHQTLAVDTVTGATITSKAILAAVEDCVRQAGVTVLLQFLRSMLISSTSTEASCQMQLVYQIGRASCRERV